MDELELRIAALETAFTWAFGLTDEGPAIAATVKDRVAMLETSLKEDMGRLGGAADAATDGAKDLRRQANDASWDDRAVMLAAAQLLEDAARRWAAPWEGV